MATDDKQNIAATDEPQYIADPSGQRGMIPNPRYTGPTTGPVTTPSTPTSQPTGATNYTPQQLQMLKNQGINPQSSAARSVAGPPTANQPYMSAQGQLIHPANAYNFQGSASDTTVPSTASPASPTAVEGTATPPFQPAYSPLAMNLFFSQAVAPMMQGLIKQNQDTNAAFQAMSGASPTSKYIPPQFQEFFKQHDAHLAQSSQVFQNSLYAAPAASAVDQLMSQMNQAREQATNAYVQAQIANNSQQSDATAAAFADIVKKATEGK